jgi:hypothetical protein
MSTRHICAFCEEERPADKRCGGCSRVWYCSKGCQENHWPHHIFDCNPKKTISTAYYLARAARQDMMPDHEQTLEDYGFNRAFTQDDKSKLLGLYQGLIVRIGVKPRDLHQWRIAGDLIQQLKDIYEKIPVRFRGNYYSWFLENQYVLDRSLPSPHELIDVESYFAEVLRRGWIYAGGSPSDSNAHIETTLSGWPNQKKSCFELYQTLSMDNTYPSPSQNAWLVFGFAGCRNVLQESDLAEVYRRLIASCTFEEFLAAFLTSSLDVLIDSRKARYRGPRPTLPWFDIEDILHGTSTFTIKSVWHLKHFIMADGGIEVEFRPAAQRDYGFTSDFSVLKSFYRGLLEKETVAPLELHDAAMRGQLFEYAKRNSSAVFDKNKKNFKRLLKNPYPLGAVTRRA